MKSSSFRFAIICLVLLVAVGCADSRLPSAPGPLAELTAPSLVEVPQFEGEMEGHVTIIPPFTAGSDPACNASFTGNPDAPGPSITVAAEYDAIFTHAGHSRLTAVSCLDPLSPRSTGTGFIEAANGDRILVAFENTALESGPDPSVVRLEGSQWITGGTGRFAGASGIQDCSFVGAFSDPNTGVISGECQGTLIFDASNASGIH